MSTVTISTLDELKAFRDAVNSGTSYKGQTVELTADIDLNGEEWTPIGKSGKTFQGIFNGNGHTVSNLVINQPGMCDVGFFGFTTNGEIKNLTIHNANIKGYLDVGAVAGSPYTSKYTNIKLTGDVVVEGYAYVGGMFGKNVYQNLTDLTIDANSGSYVKASSENYRSYVGGVIGFMGEGNQTVQNVTSNLNVIGSTCDVGGISGNAHYGNRFINVTCTAGQITLENAIDTGDHLEIGGIVGVWLNTENQTVLIINSSAPNATLKTTLNGEDKSEEVRNNTVAGKSYGSETAASGSLLIGTETKTESGTTLTFTVSGPKAADDLEKLFGPLQANADGSYTAQTTYLVRIGGAYYDTLDAALAAAKNGDTLTLLGNITLDSMLTVNKNVTIDGDGMYTLKASVNDAWNGNQMIQVSKANATFKNITLDGAEQSLTLIQAANATGLTLDGVTMQNARNGIYKGSTFNNGGLTVSNSVINVKVFAFNATGKISFITVTDSTLYGWTSFASDLTDAAASFKDCKFLAADDRDGGNHAIIAALRPYFATIVDNCQFSEAFSMTTGDYYYENGLSMGKANIIMNLENIRVVDAEGFASSIPLADLISSNFSGTGGSAVSDVAFIFDGVKDHNGKYVDGMFVGDTAVITANLADGLAPKANGDGSYSAVATDKSTLLLNSDWASMKTGETIPGQGDFYFGLNAFDKLSGAADAMTEETSTIRLTGNVEETTDTAGIAAVNRNFNFRAAQDLLLTSDDPATIKLTVIDTNRTHGGSTNSTGELAFLSESDDKRATITIESGVTINTNAKIWFGRTAVTKEVHAADVIINGTINQQSNTDTKSYGIMQIQSDKGSTVTLNGTMNLDWSLLVKGSTFTVTNTGLLGRSAGSWHDTYVSVEARDEVSGKFVLDGGRTENLSALEVKERSSAEVKNGANAVFSASISVSSNASLIIDGATLSTDALTNEGTINVSGSSTVKVGTAAGSGSFNLLDRTSLTDSKIGNADIYGNVSARNLEAGNIRIGFGRYTGDGASLSLSGKLDTNILYVGVKTVGDDAAYADRSYRLNIREAEGNIGTVNARTTAGLFIADSQNLNIGDFLIRNSTEIANSRITGKFRNNGTGHWAIYEDDDSSRTASLTVTDSTLNTNYICIGKNTNGQYEADSNAKLTLIDSTFIADSYIYLMKNTADFTTGIKLENFSVLQAKTIYNGSEILMNHNSSIKFSGEYISDGGRIVVDMNGAAAGGFFKLIDYTGADPASVNYQNVTLVNGGGYTTVTLNGDLYASNADMSKFLIDASFTGEEGTEVAEGFYLGVNAFTSAKKASEAVTDATTEIILKSGVTETVTTPVFSLGNDLTFKTADGVDTATIHWNVTGQSGVYPNDDGKVYFINKKKDTSAKPTITVEEGVTFEVPNVAGGQGSAFYLGYNTSDAVKMNLNGTLDCYLLYVAFQSELNVYETGRIKTTSEDLIVRGGTVTVMGGGKYSETDAQAKTGYTSIQGGTVTLYETVMNSGAYMEMYNRDDNHVILDMYKSTLIANGFKTAAGGNYSISVMNGSKLAINGDITVNGFLGMDATSTITGKNLFIGKGGIIAISCAGVSSGTRALITMDSITIEEGSSGFKPQQMVAGMSVITVNNTVYLTDQSQYLLHVGGKNADGVLEANTDGTGIVGWNVYDTLLEAIKDKTVITPGKTVFDFGNAAKSFTKTVQNETDKAEFNATDSFYGGKYTFTGGELAHLPYLLGNAEGVELAFEKAKLTLSKVKIEKGASMTVTDSRLDAHPHSGDLAFLSLYNDGVMNVTNSVVGIADELTDTDMPEIGKAANSDTNGVYLAKDGMSRMSLTIQGQVNLKQSTLFASYRSRVLAGDRGQGEINLNDSVMYADGLQILQAADNEGKASVNLDASALIQSHYSPSAMYFTLVIGYAAATKATAVISLTNGSLLDWSKAAKTHIPNEPWKDEASVLIDTNGTLEITGSSTAKTGDINNKGTLSVNNGTLEAAEVTNTGTIAVAGTGDLNGSFSGSVIQFADGAVLTSSKGFTYSGDYATDKLPAIGAGEFNFGSLRFDADQTNPRSVEVAIRRDAVVRVADVMEIDRRTSKTPNTVVPEVAGILTLEDGARVYVGTETKQGYFYNKFRATTNINKGAELNVYGELQNKGEFTVEGTMNLYSVGSLGISAAGRDETGATMTIDGGKVTYYDTDDSKGWFGIGTKRQNNPTWDDVDQENSRMYIRNGGQLNLNMLDGNPYDTAFGIGGYAELVVDKSSVNAASTGLQNNGELKVTDKSTMTVGKLTSNGTITVSNSTLTVSGDLTLNGSFSFDLASTITVGNLTNSGTITIDMNNVEAGQMFKLIDHTGTGTGSSYGDVTLINNAGSYRTIVIDNDLYALNVDMSVLKVNAAWAGMAAGTKVAEGYYLGINAFDALSATTGNIAKDGSDTTIEIGSDLTASGELEFDHGSGKVIFTAGSEGEKVINTGDVVFENNVNANIVVGKDVTFNIADNNNDFAVWYGNNLDLYGTIKGGQNYGSLYLYQGGHTIHAEGTLATGRLQSRYDSVTVLGAEGETRRYAEDVAVADRTDAQVNINFLFQESGTFAAKDTFVNVGAANGGDGHGIYDSNKGGVRDTNAPVFNFANTKLNAYQIQLQRSETTFEADGSVITITAEFNTNGTVNLTNTKLTVGKTLTNSSDNGSIVVENASVLTVSGTLTNEYEFNFSSDSKITLGGLVNSGMIVANMVNAASPLSLLIDYTGSGAMTLADYGNLVIAENWNPSSNYYAVVIDNDLYAVSTQLDVANVAVNADWTGKAGGEEVEPGKYFGLNAFDTTDSLAGLSALNTLSVTNTTAGSALDLAKFGKISISLVNSTLQDLTLASGSLNLDGSSSINDITVTQNDVLTITGKAAVNSITSTANFTGLTLENITVSQSVSGFSNLKIKDATVNLDLSMTDGNDSMGVNGKLAVTDVIEFRTGKNLLWLGDTASIAARGIYASNGSLDLTLTLKDNIGSAIITVQNDGIFADSDSTITLDISNAGTGSYILVSGLSSFDKRIQVNGGTLGVGESLRINGNRYTLNFSGSTLSLDVTSFVVDNDIDKNGNADILMYNKNSEAALWLMKGDGSADWKELFPFAGGDIADGWTLFDTGDTMGNKYSDVILYNEKDKDVGVWQMSEGETTWRTLERLDSDHELIAVRDFNGDGKRDLLSRGTDGSLQFHYTDGSKTERFELSSDWKVVGAGDINGDGKADVIFQNGTKSGAWLSGAENEKPQWHDLYDLVLENNSILGTGDFDGNGIADVLIATKNSDGTVSYGTWLMNNKAEAEWRSLVTMPASVVIESISDINGDGKAELRVRHGNDIASISMSVSLDSSAVLTQWNALGPVTDEWTTKLASPIL